MTPQITHLRGRRLSKDCFLAALIFASLLLGPAHAEQVGRLAPAERAYMAGDYDQAASLAHGQTSPAAAVLTARALLTKALLLDVKDPEVFALANAALVYADAARAVVPGLVEAHLDAAIARGLQADHLPVDEAITKVEEARAAIDQALMLAPNDPWVQATEGGWHLTLTGRLGKLAANLMFGASRSKGLAAFERAFVLAPDNAKLLYHYAKVRILQGDGQAPHEARAALRHLQQLAPQDALGQSLLKLMPSLMAEIDAQELARSNHLPANHLPD